MKKYIIPIAALICSIQTIKAQANDSFANPQTIANNSNVTGNNSLATTEPGERLGAVSGVTLHNTLWYRYTAPARGIVKITTVGSPGYSRAIQVFRGNSLTATNLVGFDSASIGSSAGINFQFPAEAGMEFRIVFARTFASTTGADFSFTVQQEAWPYGSTTTLLTVPDVPTTARPANDNIEQAQLIPSSPSPVSVLGYNYDATQNNLGPEPDVTGHQTLWYRWVAPQRGIAVLTTPSSPVISFTNKLTVYRGNALTALSVVAEGDSGGSSRPIILSFPVEAGMEYKVALGGRSSSQSGSFVFNVRTDAWPYGTFSTVAPGVPTTSVPLNDQFEGATTIPSALGKYTIFDYNQSATTASSSFEPSVVGRRSLWYKWTAPENATVILQTPTAPAIGFTHTLVTHTGSSYDRLTQLPVGAGSIRVTTSTGAGSTQFSAVKGTTYYFSISALSDSFPFVNNGYLSSVVFFLEALKDVEKPIITVTGKVPKKTVAKSITIAGGASDNIGVTNVQYRIGKSGPKLAAGTTSWRLTTKLKKGKNTITIFASDAAGNVSLNRVIKVTRR